ncbi:MAG TPA: phospholipase [Thermoanaerobaculia bacterium]|nr:phospholipase [Thermoanaerobaculia bacterium]
MAEGGKETRHIAALVHGTYLLERLPSIAGAPRLLVGFHGYGESAERHLDELRRIPGASRWLLCAVQALHPFYSRANEVVASWMTKLDRERAIADNIRYVASVVAEVKRETGAAERLIYAGFSQGAAMAYRAAARSGHPCQGVIVLGGDLPPELAAGSLSGFPPVLLGRGNREEWFDEAKMAADIDALRRQGIDVRPVAYEGGHEWTDEFRRAAGEFLEQVDGPGRAPARP